jgi:glyoxylase-like metal-dependent hydrolase (beta-lactamase superfamily II)
MRAVGGGFINAQVDALADWVETFDTRVRAIYITHGHSDHWTGLARLLQRFPDARGVATKEVRDRAVPEPTDPGHSAYWQGISLSPCARSRPRSLSEHEKRSASVAS